MSGPLSWVDLSEMDSPWPGHWLLGGDVPADQTAVVAIHGNWNEWSATRLGADALLQANAITVALCRVPPERTDEALPAALEACDLRVRIGASAQQGSGRPGPRWNQDCDNEDQARGWVEMLATRVHRNAAAALACARTIRLTARVTESQGLVVESLTYAMLQAGTAHRQWLAGRSR